MYHGMMPRNLKKTGSSGGATAARHTDGRNVGGTWKPSSLQRDYRTVLDRAKEEPQVILDTDNQLLVIEVKSDSDFRRGLHERVAQLARFQFALAANRDRDPSEWAAQTDFPYLAAFDQEEVDDFARELLAYTLDAGQRGTLANLEGNLRAWSSTASVYEDQNLLAALSAAIDLDAFAEVFPPSEEQVRVSSRESA
jgi:hypothetical protein